MPPGSHGPVVTDYASWAGATTVGTPAAGDLCIFLPDQHIGIAVNATEMVSALNPSLGTRRTPIGGAAGGSLIYRRINGIAGGGAVPPVITAKTGQQPGPGHPPVVVLALVAGLYLGAAVLALGVVAALAVGGRLAVRKAMS